MSLFVWGKHVKCVLYHEKNEEIQIMRNILSNQQGVCWMTDTCSSDWNWKTAYCYCSTYLELYENSIFHYFHKFTALSYYGFYDMILPWQPQIQLQPIYHMGCKASAVRGTVQFCSIFHMYQKTFHHEMQACICIPYNFCTLKHYRFWPLMCGNELSRFN